VVVAFSIFEKSVAEAGAVLAALVAAVVEPALVALVAVLAAAAECVGVAAELSSSPQPARESAAVISARSKTVGIILFMPRA
jgi:hypothetical protein